MIIEALIVAAFVIAVVGIATSAFALGCDVGRRLRPTKPPIELFSSAKVMDMERQIAANPHNEELWRQYRDYRIKFSNHF